MASTETVRVFRPAAFHIATMVKNILLMYVALIAAVVITDSAYR